MCADIIFKVLDREFIHILQYKAEEREKYIEFNLIPK